MAKEGDLWEGWEQATAIGLNKEGIEGAHDLQEGISLKLGSSCHFKKHTK